MIQIDVLFVKVELSLFCTTVIEEFRHSIGIIMGLLQSTSGIVAKN